ncbi:MAG: hypothetical protein AB7O43_11255 [Hyphomicrobiaceae bacterium]
MPMNRDGQNRMDGFLHAAGNLDSANPDVQLYREHYRGGFSGSGASTSISSQQATGGVVLGVLFGVLYAIVVAYDYVNTNWAWIAPVGGAVLLVALISVLNFFLPRYFRTALVLFLCTMVLVAIWFAGYGVYKVQTGWYPTYTKFLANYVWLEKPLESPLLAATSAFATLYGLSTLALSLLPWTRRKRPFWKMAGLSAIMLIASPAIVMGVYGVLHQLFWRV